MSSKSSSNFTIENNIIKSKRTNFNNKTQNNGQILLQLFDENPNHVGQIEVETGLETRYSEMRDSSVRCALWLEKQNLNADDVVAICTPLQPGDYIPVIGSIFAGLVYNPWHHEVTLKSARHLAALTRPRIFFCTGDSLKVLREAVELEGLEAQFITFDRCTGVECLKDILAKATDAEVKTYQVCGKSKPEDLAVILFSSGTTGLPKGIMLPNRTLGHFISGSHLASSTCSRLLWYSSLYWISGNFCILQAISSKSIRILHSNFEPEATCRIIEKFKVDWFLIAPSQVAHLCKADVLDKYNLKTLKVLIATGSKLARELIDYIKLRLPNVVFAQLYGMTESGGAITVSLNWNTAGFVTSDAQIKIADETSNEALGPNQLGEICFKTSNVMLGYYKNPKATKDMIDAEGWYHSGDRGYYLENGELIVIDRLKEVMKFRGYQISAFEIEEHLMSHTDIIEAAVVPVLHELDLEIPMAFVRKVTGSELTEEEVVKLSMELGDTRKLRGGVQFVDKLPYTPSEKVNRKLLKEMAQVGRS